MEKITSLAKKLKSDSSTRDHLQHLTITSGEMFSWNHKACAITYNPRASNAHAYLLHEYGHALLNHAEYNQDISLLHMEVSAWQQAKTVALDYKVNITSEIIDDAIDTYRHWLHNRSICPQCSSSGLEIKKLLYRCYSCETSWVVNEAKNCNLRRYKIKTP